MYECKPKVGAKILKEIPKSMRKLYPNPICCISMEVDWIKRPITEILCSMQKERSLCKMEIKLFRATVYRYCVQNGIKEIANTISGGFPIQEEMKRKFGKIMRDLPKFVKIFKSSMVRKKANEIKILGDTIKDIIPIVPKKIHPILKRKSSLYNKIKNKLIIKNNLPIQLPKIKVPLKDNRAPLDINKLINRIKNKDRAWSITGKRKLNEDDDDDDENSANKKKIAEVVKSSPGTLPNSNSHSLEPKYAPGSKPPHGSDIPMLTVSSPNNPQKPTRKQKSNSEIITTLSNLGAEFSPESVNKINSIVTENPEIMNDVIKHKITLSKEFTNNIPRMTLKDLKKKLTEILNENSLNIKMKKVYITKNCTGQLPNKKTDKNKVKQGERIKLSGEQVSDFENEALQEKTTTNVRSVNPKDTGNEIKKKKFALPIDIVKNFENDDDFNAIHSKCNTQAKLIDSENKQKIGNKKSDTINSQKTSSKSLFSTNFDEEESDNPIFKNLKAVNKAAKAIEEGRNLKLTTVRKAVGSKGALDSPDDEDIESRSIGLNPNSPSRADRSSPR